MKIYPELDSIAAEYEDVLKERRNHDAARLNEQCHNLMTEIPKIRTSFSIQPFFFFNHSATPK
ncbi:hypothetical protein VSK90_07880 [Bacillus swezeyi]|uniref:hypothetical protein n=1 Tax=Bacillus swezeyi TaxID=1925020 RepID=UPI0039C5D833